VTPIEQIRPLPPANWVLRVEEKRKRQDKASGREPGPQKDHKPGDPGERPEHSVDELA
jgi:hypothetical protein